MPEVNKIKCWLEDGDTGERLPEYQTRKKKTSASAIVISEEGKSFSINLSGAVNDTTVGISIGGKRLENIAFARDTPKGQKRMLGQNSELHRLCSGLTPPEAVEDDRTLKEECQKSRVVVKLYRANGDRFPVDLSTSREEKRKLKRKTIYKRAKNQGLRDCVLYGNEFRGKLQGCYLGYSTGPPLAKFTFKIRTRLYLEKKGVISPRTSPSPSTSQSTSDIPKPNKKRKFGRTEDKSDTYPDEKIKKLEGTVEKWKRRCAKLRKHGATGYVGKGEMINLTVEDNENGKESRKIRGKRRRAGNRR